jgi:hypothetical protein
MDKIQEYLDLMGYYTLMTSENEKPDRENTLNLSLKIARRAIFTGLALIFSFHLIHSIIC